MTTNHRMGLDISFHRSQALVTEPWCVRRKHLAALLQPPGRLNALRLSGVADERAPRNGHAGGERAST